MKALVDGDILTYRFGFASEGKPAAIVKARVDEFLTDLLLYDLEADDLDGYLSGDGNYRHQIAVTAPYKGNRPKKKPEHYGLIREHLADSWGFEVVHGEEADDAMGIASYAYWKQGKGDDVAICTIDKDLDMIPGWHFNFVKRIKYHVSPWEGIVWFYTQILTGDRIDNVIGIRGVGPAGAARILKDCSNERELYDAVVSAYDGDAERVLENARLLWIRREPGEIWIPPTSQ